MSKSCNFEIKENWIGSTKLGSCQIELKHCKASFWVGKPRQIWQLQSDQDIGVVILSHQPTNSGPWKAKYQNHPF